MKPRSATDTPRAFTGDPQVDRALRVMAQELSDLKRRLALLERPETVVSGDTEGPQPVAYPLEYHPPDGDLSIRLGLSLEVSPLGNLQVNPVAALVNCPAGSLAAIAAHVDTLRDSMQAVELMEP